MIQDRPTQEATTSKTSPPQKTNLSEAAQRALKEAELRRQQKTELIPHPQKEIGGRDGPDPVRYKDWEKNGLISDF